MSNPAISSTQALFHTIAIETPNVEELVMFYGAAFELGPAFPPGGDHRGFHIGELYLGFDRSERSGGERNPVSIWFEVNDLRATLDRLIDLGARVKEEPRPGRWGQEVAAVYDPDGNVVGIVGRRTATMK